MRITSNQTLDRIEDKLRDKIKDSIVVSELDLSSNDLDRLLVQFQKHVTFNDQKEMINILWVNYPYTSLVITVFIAVYKYDGSLWDHFTEKTGIEDTPYWGKKLLAFLKKNSIRVFHEEDRQKYFSTVLGHAGIPYYSVEKLLQNIIIPANERGWNEIDIYENVKKVENSTIHKGVRTFIGIGDQVSFSMIHRIQTVWRDKNKPFVKNYRNYLPNHILQAMDEYTPEEEQDIFHYERQYIYYDVEDGVIGLRIPSIRVREIYVEDLYWIIKENECKTETKIETELLHYEEGGFEEFIPTKDFVPLKPNHSYTIELFYEDEEDKKLIYQDQQSTKPPFIQYNRDKKLVHLEDAFLEKEYHSITVIVQKSQVQAIKDQKRLSNEKELSNKWKNYSAVTIIATEREMVTIESFKIYLNPELNDPFLEGERQDNLSHTDYPVFKDIPYIVLPKKVLKEIKAKAITHVRLSNLQNHKTDFIKINTANIVTLENEARLNIDELFSTIDEKLASYSITMYGKIGYDYHFTFILMKDFRIQLNQFSNALNLQMAQDYSFTIQWPLNVEIRKDVKGNRYEISRPNHEYKMKALFYRSQSNLRFDFILYTALYKIQFLANNQDVYPVGSEISREEWQNRQLKIVVDTANPSFAKKMGSRTELEIIGDPNPIHYPIFSNSIVYFPTDGSFEKKLKRDILYQYKFSNEESYHPLLTVRNKWTMSQPEENWDRMNLSLKWEQSNYLNEKFIRIWKLHKPHELWTDIPLKKRTKSFQYQFDEAGIYLVEWKDNNIENVDKPVFEKGKYKIFRVDTNKSLAYHLLLLEDNLKNFGEDNDLTFEYEMGDILDLLERIYFFGEKYLSLIVEDYDTCCDFTIRAGNVLSEIFEQNKMSKHLKNILLEITGVQELNDQQLFKVYNGFLNKHYKSNFERIRPGYFSSGKFLSVISRDSSKQLNIKMQEVKPFSPIIFGFDLRTTMIKYFYKVNNDPDFERYVKGLFVSYSKKLKNIYRKIKEATNNVMQFQVFRIIEGRNFKKLINNGSPGYEYYPYFIAQLALANSSFVRFSENNISEEDRKVIREATQQVLHVDKDWFLHDLFYIVLLIEETNRKTVEKKKI